MIFSRPRFSQYSVAPKDLPRPHFIRVDFQASSLMDDTSSPPFTDEIPSFHLSTFEFVSIHNSSAERLGSMYYVTQLR